MKNHLSRAINETPRMNSLQLARHLSLIHYLLNHEDIPYEVRMKHIIEAYRKDQEKWGKLAQYAKHLEGEVIRLKLILIDNGYTDSGIEGDYDAAEEISKLKKKIKKLEDKIENVYPRKQKSNLNMKR